MRQLDIPEDALQHAQSELSGHGFSFVLQPDHPLSDYGVAFLTEGWIRACWAPRFHLVTYIPGWLDDWQDGYLLRRGPWE